MYVGLMKHDVFLVVIGQFTFRTTLMPRRRVWQSPNYSRFFLTLFIFLKYVSLYGKIKSNHADPSTKISRKHQIEKLPKDWF